MPAAINTIVGSLETAAAQVDVIAHGGVVSVVMDRRGLFSVLDMTPAEADYLAYMVIAAARRFPPSSGESGTPRGGA